ncbi:MAG TPA: glycosyltransferase family 9 protein [Ktedonobacterales bacterium]
MRESSLRGGLRAERDVEEQCVYESLFGSTLRLGETSVLPFTPPRISERERAGHDGALPTDPAHILVSLLLPIGDTLLATPALAALRRRFPWAKITAMVSHSNAGILSDNPNIDQLVFVAERGAESRVRRFARGLSDLRQNKFDLIITFSPVSSIVLRMAGLYRRPLRVEMPALWWLLGGHSSRYRNRHAVDHYLQAVMPVLDEEPSEEDRQPRIYLTARDRTAARVLLREAGLSPANLLIAMHVGGEGFEGRKRWAPRRFAAVANHLIELFHAHILLIGGGDDAPLCDEVAGLIAPSKVTVLAGRTSLKETAALIEMSAMFIGNDSCPLHIAAAVNTPSVGIFGPSNIQQFQPIGKRNYRQRMVHSNLPCAPCFHFIGNGAPWVPNTCHSMACLKAITPEMVATAATELLREQVAGEG